MVKNLSHTMERVDGMYKIYIVILLVLSIGFPIILGGNMFAYGVNNQNNSNSKSGTDPKNQACYNAGFAVGRQNNTHPNQSVADKCGTNVKAYQEGVLSGCVTGQGKDYFTCQRLTNSPGPDVGTGGSVGPDLSGGNGGGGEISGGNGGGEISGGGGFGGNGGG
jgi:hypothetical protein